MDTLSTFSFSHIHSIYKHIICQSLQQPPLNDEQSFLIIKCLNGGKVDGATENLQIKKIRKKGKTEICISLWSFTEPNIPTCHAMQCIAKATNHTLIQQKFDATLCCKQQEDGAAQQSQTAKE